jgi:hypothetical protein
MTPLGAYLNAVALGENQVTRARAWAESDTAPGDPGTKSSKTSATEAAASAQIAVDAAADVVGNAIVRAVREVLAADLTNPLILDYAPSDTDHIDLIIDAATQSPKDFTLSGNELTFTDGWPADTEIVVYKIYGAAAVLSDSGFASHRTREAAVQWLSSLEATPADGAIFCAGSQIYQVDAAYNLPGLPGCRPFGGDLSILHYASADALASDFAAQFEGAATLAIANKWKLHMHPLPSGLPYSYEFIDYTMTGNLHVVFYADAIWQPTTNFQHFPTGGLVGPFTVSDFGYDQSTWGDLSAMLVESDDTETGLDITTDEMDPQDFFVTGLDVELETAPPAGSTLVVAGRKNALTIRSTIAAGYKLTGTGTFTANLENYGYAIGKASGSGFAPRNITTIYLDMECDVYSAETSGYGAAPLDKRGDSAVVPLGFKSCYIKTVRASRINDLAVYASGDGSSDLTDDAEGLIIDNVIAYRTAAGLKYERQGRGGYVKLIHATECGTAFVRGITGDLPTGSNTHIATVVGTRLGRRVLSITDCPQGGLSFGNVSCEGLGFYPDGVTPVSGAAGIFMSECAMISVDEYSLTRIEDAGKWAEPSGVAAVKFSGENNFGNRIKNGSVTGFEIGIEETGGTTNDTGNEVKLLLQGVTTPLSLAAGSDTLYDLTIQTDTAGTIATTYKRRMSPKVAFTPNLYRSGTAAPAAAREEGTYIHDPNGMVHFSADCQVNAWTFTPSGAQIRISLPASCVTLGAEVVTAPVNIIMGVNAPATNIEYVGEILSGDTSMLIRYKDTASNTSGALTDAHITSGTNVRIKTSGSYFAAE